MRTWKQAAAIVTVVLLCGAPAGAAISFDMVPVDNSAALTGYTTYDMQVTTDTDWTSAAMLTGLTAGSLYQHEYGAITGPPSPFLIDLFPAVEFDTYVIGSTAGGGGDIGRRNASLVFDTATLDVSWYNLTETDIGTTTIGRVTMSDDAVGNLSILLMTANNEEAEFDVLIDSGTAQASAPGGGEMLSVPGTFSYVGYGEDPLRTPVWREGVVDTREFVPADKSSYLLPRTTAPSTELEESLPEPGSFLLVGLGLAGTMTRRRLA